MSTTLTDLESNIEILLKDKIFHAKLKCKTTQFLHPQKFTEISLKIIENSFALKHGENFETYWSPFNAIKDASELESHVTWHLRYFFSTESKPSFVTV